MRLRHLLSRTLIEHSEDLLKLKEDGYQFHGYDETNWLSFEVLDWLERNIHKVYWHNPIDWITVKDIPYVCRPVKHSFWGLSRGDLSIPLWLEGCSTIKPKEHWAVWHGGVPCFSSGMPQWRLLTPQRVMFKNVIVLSRDQDGDYIDHHDKLDTYVALIESQAQILNPTVSARKP